MSQKIKKLDEYSKNRFHSTQISYFNQINDLIKEIKEFNLDSKIKYKENSNSRKYIFDIFLVKSWLLNKKILSLTIRYDGSNINFNSPDFCECVLSEKSELYLKIFEKIKNKTTKRNTINKYFEN